MRKILILTSNERGTASRALPSLQASDSLEIVGVVMAQTHTSRRKRMVKRKIKKVANIGPLGAVNGVRMRSWYRDDDTPNVRRLADSYSIPVYDTEVINSDPTRKLFRELDPDLGLSLGNAYIAKSVFSIPTYGMLNLHSEILPDFQGAQSVIWPIYKQRTETGFTIHQLNKNIDDGDILYQEKYPIDFRPTLKETVVETIRKTRMRFPPALRHVCETYEERAKEAISQEGGESFTTPSISEFTQMLINHQKLYRQQQSD
jgi:methionyl-tRNA formyltransferase